MTAEMANSLEQPLDIKFAPALDPPLSMTPPQTPTAMATAAHKVFAEIQSIHNALTTLTTLAPGPEINSLLTRLVELCALPHSSDLSQEILRLCAFENLCEKLRPLCGAAEGYLENHWAQRIIRESKSNASLLRQIQVSFPHKQYDAIQTDENLESTLAQTTTTTISSASSSTTDPLPSLLKTFPYHQNYTDLTQLEVSAITPYLASAPRNIAFIGSGPLPLTSICLQSHYPSAHIINIDRDTNALRTSQELCTSVGCGDRMGYAADDVSVEAEKGLDWKSFDVVFFAALVGMDSPSKITILASLATKMTPGTLVVARSARGVRSVLYPVRQLILRKFFRSA